jgi:hypothetical protein
MQLRAVLQRKITHYLLYKRTICAKCENPDAFCVTIISKNRRTFAAEFEINNKQ